MSLVDRAQNALSQGHETEHQLEEKLEQLRDPRARAEEERRIAADLLHTRRVVNRLQSDLDELLAFLAAGGRSERGGLRSELVSDSLDGGQSHGGDVGGSAR